MSSLIDEFVTITGSDAGTAKHMLEACNNNLEQAVSMFLDNKPSADASSSKPGSSSAQPTDDNVRAPIPQTRGVLVEDGYSTTAVSYSRRRPHTVFDAFRDLKAETKRQEAFSSSSDKNEKNKLKRLEDLFRPPIELMHRGNLDSARKSGESNKKWLLVNVQNVKEFSCQVLNRDVWSNKVVQEMIKENFIFWQVYSDSEDGSRFMTFYPVSVWPHVSVLDPRTGERLAIWNNITAQSLTENLAQFLDEHGKLTEDEDEPPSKRKKVENDIVDASEDSQLLAAIEASLKETKKQTANEEFILDDSEDEFYPSSGDESEEETTNGLNEKHENGVEKEIKNTEEKINNETTQSKTMVKIHPKEMNKNSKEMCNILLRLPDGQREKVILHRDNLLKVLFNRTIQMGYPKDQYELITNFPKQNLSVMDPNDTLNSAGLFPHGTVFIQEI